MVNTRCQRKPFQPFKPFLLGKPGQDQTCSVLQLFQGKTFSLQLKKKTNLYL